MKAMCAMLHLLFFFDHYSIDEVSRIAKRIAEVLDTEEETVAFEKSRRKATADIC